MLLRLLIVLHNTNNTIGRGKGGTVSLADAQQLINIPIRALAHPLLGVTVNLDQNYSSCLAVNRSSQFSYYFDSGNSNCKRLVRLGILYSRHNI